MLAAPRKTRLILDSQHWYHKSGGSLLDKLQEGLQSMQCSQYIHRGQIRASCGDFERVGLVLAQLLHLAGIFVAADDQSCFGSLSRLLHQWHAGFTAQLSQKTGDAVFQTGILGPFNGHCE